MGKPLDINVCFLLPCNIFHVIGIILELTLVYMDVVATQT